MKAIIAIAAVATLAGCASEQPYLKQMPFPDDPKLGMGTPSYMTRAEVISATQECEQASMRPRVVYGQTTVNEKKVPVPIDVHCEPMVRRPVSPYLQPRTE